MRAPVLSLIVPVFNEARCLPEFLAVTLPILETTGEAFEILFVDDGSTDDSAAIIENMGAARSEIRLVALSRNFGKEAALTCGLEHAQGTAVIPIDCDLQDPPELIPQMLELWRQGHQVIHARRADRSSDSRMKRWTANAYHALLRRLCDDVPIPDNCGDFRLMDRQVVDAILQFPERARYMKGLMAAAGFRSICLDYTRPPRHTGESSFGYFRLMNLALEGLTGFSTAPLRIWTYLGGLVALGAFVFALWTISKTLLWGVVTPGYATLLTVSLALGGLNMVGIGVLGIYLGKVLIEVKQRPLYIVGRYAGNTGRPRTTAKKRLRQRPSSPSSLGSGAEVRH